MRNYQSKKKNPYLLPHNVYMQTLYLIRDYERLKEEYSQLMNPSTTMSKQSKKIRGVICQKIDAIENAAKEIPEYYQKGVWNNVLYGYRYPINADIRTWQTYKQRFIYYTAQNMQYV